MPSFPKSGPAINDWRAVSPFLLDASPATQLDSNTSASAFASNDLAEAARFFVSLLRRAELIQPARTPRKPAISGTRWREARYRVTSALNSASELAFENNQLAALVV